MELLRPNFAPDDDLVPLRKAAYQYYQDHPQARLPIHWLLLGAAYPFWFSVAAIVGRLLNLQDQVTQTQIVSRLKEKGCYEKISPVSISETELSVLMIESALLAIPEAKSALGLLLSNPAFFPFQLPVVSGDYLSQNNDRIEVVRYGLDDELLKLNACPM